MAESYAILKKDVILGVVVGRFRESLIRTLHR